MAKTNRILIVGAGPAGLSMARALSGHGLDIQVFERASRESLASPADDGREIALTHRSERLLRELGHWERLKAQEIGHLREALVLDGNAQDGLRFNMPGDSGDIGPLGWLIPNAALRRIAFDAVADRSDVTLHTEAVVTDVGTVVEGARLVLADGRRFHGDLLLAADTRFSFARRACGIAADHHDFGKVMLVGRVRHDQPHNGTAWEWFRYGQTLALLPLHDAHTASVVITVAPAEALALQSLSPESLGDALSQRFDQRLGVMTPLGPLHAYPLVGVYPRRFVGERFALIGDAAVGMHPVTAHGYNFGLLGVATLSELLKNAQRRGRPLHDPRLLADYERRHRRATRPLYLATRVVAGLYTDDRLPARALRKAAVAVAGRLPGFASAVVKGLRDDDRGASPRWPMTSQLFSGFLSKLRSG
jgi:ubiquinone biosynthesis UbiH/UbiF/VisC/COQ6 family hydroxylase